MSVINSHRRGAVSLFVVIFTALLITIVTVSFTRLMLREQQRASDNDLSQSAYDAALAGVEDAKRALTIDSSAADLDQCNGIASVLGGDSSGEVQVGDDEMNQAYTCVKVETVTDDYVGDVGADQVRLIPLRAGSTINQVRIDWFNTDDVSEQPSLDVDLPVGADSRLTHDWPVNRPPVLEAQLMQTGDSFRLSNFDGMTDNHSNVNTLALYPKNIAAAGLPTTSFALDDRRPNSQTSLTDAKCSPSLTAVAYSCSALISLPEPVDGTHNSRRNAFLRLTPRYRGTHFRITLLDSSNNLVRFNGVQPTVDSTGRAGDLFRRVSARVELGSRTIYPEAAVDVHGNFCKTFRITDDHGDYITGSCEP